MLLTRRARFMAAPLGVLLLVSATHQGYYSGSYRPSRADVARQAYYTPLDGYLLVLDGIPTQVDASNTIRLQGIFRGDEGPQASGILDMRPVPSFLQACVEPVVGRFWSGSVINLVFMALAVASALDLARLLGRPPLVAVAFATLVAGGRGVAFYVGCPDAHSLSLAWFPIGVWACERLQVTEREAHPLGPLVVTLILGAATLTHLYTVTLVLYLWLRGLGRAPLTRLLAISAGTIVLLAGWRVVGATAGLGFDAYADRGIPDGLRGMAAEIRDRVLGCWQPPPAGSGLRATGNEVIQALRRLPPWGIIMPLRLSLVPAFGAPLLLLAMTGWFLAAERRDRFLALGWFVPPCLVALPIIFYWTAPRLLYPAWLGLAWLAALALARLETTGRRALARMGASPGLASTGGRALFMGGLGGLLLLENADALGDLRGVVTLFYS